MCAFVHPKNACYFSIKMYKLRSSTELILTRRHLHTKPPREPKNPLEDNEKWSIIYKLPVIRLAAAFNRMKVYQGLLTTFSLPVTHLVECYGHLPENCSFVVGAVGISGFLTLSLTSFCIQNLVGFIYIDNKHEKLKLAYVDFWGKRRHTIAHVDDVLPNVNENKLGRLLGVQRICLASNANKTYKLLTRHSEVVDHFTYSSIFGDSE